MKKWLAVMFLVALGSGGLVWASESVLPFQRFGKVSLYRPEGVVDAVVLFISGDGGWNQGVVEMARALSSMGAMVAGVDIRHYLEAMDGGKGVCAYPAADFEALSQYLQKQQGFSDYQTPILVGYSSGATLVYGLLAQAPGNTFAGGISLGFCPDLSTAKPLCKGAGLTYKRQKIGFVYDPVQHLKKPWIALQGEVDQVCDPLETRRFVAQVPQGRIVELPRVGHGFSVLRNWMPQFKAAYQDVKRHAKMAATGLRPPDAAVGDLPLTEVPASDGSGRRMAVFFSGDGGWADLDQKVSAYLAAHGLPVVGVNSLKYFWKKRSPDEAARDLERIVDHYANCWKSNRVVLVGYSFGADVMPFMATRLSPQIAGKIELIALLGLSRTAEFEFHVAGWAGGSSAAARPVEPEMRKLGATPILCLYGEAEKGSLCRERLPGNVCVVAVKGAHHFGGDYTGIGREIVAALKP